MDMSGTWHVVNTGLTNTKVYAMVIDPMDPNTLNAGADDDIFMGTDIPNGVAQTQAVGRA